MAEAVDDTAISAKVRAALATDPALSALKIDVTTREGVVELTGPGTGAAPSGKIGNSNALFLAPCRRVQGSWPRLPWSLQSASALESVDSAESAAQTRPSW